MKHVTPLHLQARAQSARPAGGAAPGARGAGGRGAGPHILLVDDDVSLLKLLGMRLESRGFRVTTAESGREALKALERKLNANPVWQIGADGSTGLGYCTVTLKEESCHA